MKRTRIYTGYFLIFLSGFMHGFAQNNLATVQANIDRRQILIGEPIHLMLEANVPLGTEVDWFKLDSIPHFEYIQKGIIDSITTESGKTFRQHITLTSFDSGSWTIPPLPVLLNNTRFVTDSARIEVGYTPFDPKQDYHDIKDIIAVENPDTKYILWVLIGITVLSALLFAWFVRKKQKAKAPEKKPEPKLSPYLEAVKSLEELKKERLPEKGEVKLYYTRLNDILRQYVSRKLSFSLMEKTNEEAILRLRQEQLSSEQFSQLASALRMSDFVKFAKYLPDAEANEKNFEIIQSSVRMMDEMSIREIVNPSSQSNKQITDKPKKS